MSKSGLGRGLGELLDGIGDTGSVKAEQIPLAPPIIPKPGPGLRLLLEKRAAAVLKSQALSAGGLAQKDGRLILSGSLIGADLLICILALVWWRTVEAPLTPGCILFLMIAIFSGAWLGCLALWQLLGGDR